MSRSIERRLLNLENKLFKKLKITPGTHIMRELKLEGGWYWCLSVGALNMRKQFFYGDTISEAIKEAEEYYG